MWVDLEHAALGPLEAQEMILGAQAAGTHALVRLPADALPLMTTMLDAGADGVVLADVASSATAAAATARLAHPPNGVRGWGPRRAGAARAQGGHGARPSRCSGCRSRASRAWSCAEEIARVDGIDALVVGTADLSFALGTPHDTRTSEVLAAIEAMRRAAGAAGSRLGLAGALDSLPAEACAGASILVHSTDARLCAGAVDDAADVAARTEEGGQ